MVARKADGLLPLEKKGKRRRKTNTSHKIIFPEEKYIEWPLERHFPGEFQILLSTELQEKLKARLRELATRGQRG